MLSTDNVVPIDRSWAEGLGMIEEFNDSNRHANVGTEGHIDHALAIKDLDHLRKFYTREGAIQLIKQHWPDLLLEKIMIDKLDYLRLIERTGRMTEIRLCWSSSRNQQVLLKKNDVDGVILALKELICILETEKRDGYLL